jgi:Alginate export
MRWILIGAVLVVSLSASARAQDYDTSTGYSLEPWDEDYSYLSNPANRTDPFDVIKYIPIGNEPDWYLTLGGQVRDRFDYFNNNEFGNGIRDNGFDLIRMLADVDAHFGKNVRAFVQLDSSLEYMRAGGPRAGDADNIDFQQAFIDLNAPLNQADTEDLTIRVGRQELAYGAQRLISPNDWRNERLTFDGVKASLYLPHDTLDIFAARPVIPDKNQLNSDNDHTYFGGIYNVTELPAVLPGAGSKLDLYLLELDQFTSAANPVDSNTYTLGTRFHSTPGSWDFDVEPDWQFGKYSMSHINAWAFAAEGGYTFSSVALKPRLSAGADLASGSGNPAGRFNQLFPPQYMYLGHMYLFGRENLIDLHPGLEFHPIKDITVSVAQHFFWRQNTSSAVYNLNSAVVAADASSRSAYLGSETDFAIDWQIDRHFSALLGYSHFFTGTFLHDAGDSEDEDFVFAMITFTF